jgi:hypothetical protein
MTDVASRIKRIFELDRKRTQGEWEFRRFPVAYAGKHEFPSVHNGDRVFVCSISKDLGYEHNGDFIAAAPEAVSIIKELLVVIEKQREVLENISNGISTHAITSNQDELFFDAIIKTANALQLSEPYVNLDQPEEK